MNPLKQLRRHLPDTDSLCGHLPTAFVFIIALSVIAACQSSPQAATSPSAADTVQQAANAFVQGYNSGDLSEFDTYFATPDQGGNAEGLVQTLEAAHSLLDDQQTAGDDTSVELHSFDILKTNVDEQHQEASVDYKANISVIAHGNVPFFAGIVQQHVGLVLVNGHWLITGADKPQITPDVSTTPVGDGSSGS